MNVVVCVKQIINPVTGASFLDVDLGTMHIIPKDPKLVKMLVSDYDLNAVEAAIQIAEANGGNVTVISLGTDSAIDSIKECLAMGANEGILLSDPLFDDANIYSTAYALSQSIRKIGDVDLVLCGVEEGDWDAGEVGSGIAKFLSIPCITGAGKIELNNNIVRVERIVDDGREILELALPALLTVRSEVGTPRYPTMKKIIAARKAQIPTWNAEDINADSSMIGAEAVKVKIAELFIPLQEKKTCTIIDAASPEEAGAEFAVKLKEANLI